MNTNNRQNRKVGVVHPGMMGISVAATVQNGGHTVYWASEGRGEKTRERAEQHHLEDAGTLQELCRTVEVIICVCPPHAAEEVAGQVVSQGFQGIFVDANAISPQRTLQITATMDKAGIAFVDGGIVGLPTAHPGETWLHLSGKQAEEIAGLFASGPIETNIIGQEPGKASALKMCYAAYTKGSTALLSAVLAAAETMGVRMQLEQQWANHWPGFADETHNRIRNVTVKAWRFSGEMREIASTFQHAGMPPGFHQAAEEIYNRLSHYKDASTKPAMEEVLESLKNKG